MTEYRVPEKVHKEIDELYMKEDWHEHVMKELDVYSCPVDVLIMMGDRA
jgi:hypothetical protein